MKYVSELFKGTQNVQRKLQVVAVSDVITEISKTTGKPYTFKDVTLRDEFGNDYAPTKFFIPVVVGDWVIGMVPAGEKYPKWSLADGIDPNKLPSQPAAPRTQKVVEQKETDWDAIADSKIIHSFIVEAYKDGKTPEQAVKDAVAFYKAQMEASRLAGQHRKMQDMGISTPTQTTDPDSLPF